MGILADSLFTVLMSWVRALVSAIWALFSSDHTTVLGFLAKNWLAIALVIIAAGLVIDWIIWLLRWQPYHLWAQRARRLLRIDSAEDDEGEEEALRAHAAVTRGYARVMEDDEQEEEPEADFFPLQFEAGVSEADAQQAMEHADSVPDEELGVYPGMRYDSTASERTELSGTQRYAAVHVQGPGAAEVERRRAEIDAFKLQMQEEARARAEAERAAREAEQARAAQAAYEAEQARRAEEAHRAYEAEQARRAQEEYQRQLAEYECQKAQYERDLAEYERQKAEYEAQLAAQADQTAQIVQTAQPIQNEAPARRRRSVKRTYSDYVEGEAVSELPDAPQWPQMQHLPVGRQEAPALQEEKKSSRILSRVAHMIEPEEEELVSRKVLPPRVDPNEAFHTAKLPVIGNKRRKR